MANEIAFSGSLSVYKPSIMGSPVGRSIAGFLASMAGNFTVEATVSIAITATALPLGQVTQPSMAVFHNLDATNFIRLHNGSTGAKLVKLLAGDWAFLRLDDTATPYATADTAACLLEYLIASL